MEITTSGTTLPQVTADFLYSDFSAVARDLERKHKSTSLQPFINLRGQIYAGDYRFPIQRFSLQKNENLVLIENFPTDSFPKINIVLEIVDSSLKVEEFNIRASDSSVRGSLLYTRLLLLTGDTQKCSLHFKDIDFQPLDFGFFAVSQQERGKLIYLAKIIHKLSFLEEFFKIKFIVPEYITPNDSKQIEILFRGVTEGEFTTVAGNSITVFNYKVTDEDLQNLSMPQKKSFSFEFDEDLMVLGKFFPIGKMTFSANKAAIANPRGLWNFKAGDIVPQLRLSIFDYQVKHSFEKYFNKERLLKSRQKLEQFKNILRKDEPEFLVNLLDELLPEIDDKSAIEIVTGWLQYYDFPDRYTVGEPILEGDKWRVPILLTYPKEKSIWIEDAFVNSKTGIVEIKSSVEQLRKKGKKKAEEVFSFA